MKSIIGYRVYRDMYDDGGMGMEIPIYEEDCFEFQGVWIVDPTVSECMRFKVDPIEYYGEAYINWKRGQDESR